ncbi:hypothetical protein KL86DES1_20891 [uncultured Desulfovibrio sp.]|uniref:Uncharacterized protein n=1 Tax=uncultured Desulfovibrio sp. TaxID=167968 RepID=A0A212L5M1_9BACT|nr:hypothetical protein KL86DES1_20891 [uncultured Desulfovibrio sp.]
MLGHVGLPWVTAAHHVRQRCFAIEFYVGYMKKTLLCTPRLRKKTIKTGDTRRKTPYREIPGRADPRLWKNVGTAPEGHGVGADKTKATRTRVAQRRKGTVPV